MQNLSRHISNETIGNTDTSYFVLNLGNKRYELSNHLGNVLSVISDKPIPHDDGSGNADYWQADILSSYDYSPFGVMLSGRTFEKEELVQVCHDSTTVTTLTVLSETFDTWFTWTTMGSALLTYVDGEMQVSNPNNSKQNIGASKTFTTGSGVHAVSFDITDNSCSNIQLWPPALIPVPISVNVRDNSNNIVASGSYTVAGNYNLSFTPSSSGLTYKIEFYMANASAFCYFAVDNVLITYQDTDTVQVCEQVSKSGKYPYSFQSQLRDDEITKGQVNFQYRGYDPRLGRLNWATDPLAAKYPYYTPYSFSGNEVIHAGELEGLEPVIRTIGAFVTNEPKLNKPSEWYINQYIVDGRSIFNTDWKSFDKANSYNTEKLLVNSYRNIEDRHEYYGWVSTKLSASSGKYWFQAAKIVTAWNGVGAAEGLNFGLLNGDAERFLKSGNSYLMYHNMKNAGELIKNGSLSGSFTNANGEKISFDGLTGKNLDYALVEFEQTLVQKFIDSYSNNHPKVNMKKVIQNVNEQFSGCLQKAFMNRSQRSTISKYFMDEKGVVKFDFNNYNDRVKLGQKLTDKLRNENKK